MGGVDVTSVVLTVTLILVHSFDVVLLGLRCVHVRKLNLKTVPWSTVSTKDL